MGNNQFDTIDVLRGSGNYPERIVVSRTHTLEYATRRALAELDKYLAITQSNEVNSHAERQRQLAADRRADLRAAEAVVSETTQADSARIESKEADLAEIRQRIRNIPDSQTTQELNL